jgi:hypothetical protein
MYQVRQAPKPKNGMIAKAVSTVPTIKARSSVHKVHQLTLQRCLHKSISKKPETIKPSPPQRATGQHSPTEAAIQPPAISASAAVNRPHAQGWSGQRKNHRSKPPIAKNSETPNAAHAAATIAPATSPNVAAIIEAQKTITRQARAIPNRIATSVREKKHPHWVLVEELELDEELEELELLGDPDGALELEELGEGRPLKLLEIELEELKLEELELEELELEELGLEELELEELGLEELELEELGLEELELEELGLEELELEELGLEGLELEELGLEGLELEELGLEELELLDDEELELSGGPE